MYISIFLFLAGIAVGSFLNVVGLRIPEKKSLVSPRSACPSCNYRLKAMDLVPVFSYLWLSGKCRNCRRPISIIYPLMELATGGIFVYAYWHTENLMHFAFVAFLMCVLISLTVSDFAYRLVPDRIQFPSFLLLVPFGLALSSNTVWNHLLGGFLFFTGTLLISFLSKGGIGGGDIKLLGLLGLTLGLKEITLIFIVACFIGAVVGLTLKLLRGETAVPFVPFISIGALLILLHEEVFWALIAHG